MTWHRQTDSPVTLPESIQNRERSEVSKGAAIGHSAKLRLCTHLLLLREVESQIGDRRLAGDRDAN